MFIQHHFSKHCTRAELLNFFYLFLALSLPPEGMHFSPPEKQTSVWSAGVGGGKHIPGCSSSLKPQMPPTSAVCPARHPVQVPSIQASPRSPGRGQTGYAAGYLTSSHFLFGFKEQNRGDQTATPGAVQPAHMPMARQGGSAQASLCSPPSQRKSRADAAAEVSLEGVCADASQPSGNMPKPWHLASA